YAAMLNAGITPIVREYGSLGCSGDLAPLAHIALAAMGEGEVRVIDPRSLTERGTSAPRSLSERGTSTSRSLSERGTSETKRAADALTAASVTPLELREKEGLALI